MRKGSEGAAGQTPSSLHSSSAQVSSKTDPRKSVYCMYSSFQAVGAHYIR